MLYAVVGALIFGPAVIVILVLRTADRRRNRLMDEHAAKVMGAPEKDC